MKLLNRTPIPDEAIQAVLLKAGRAVRAKTTNVVVQVNPAYRSVHIRGMAYNCTWVQWVRGSKIHLRCSGAFKISLPVRPKTECLHIRQYTDGRTETAAEWRDRNYDPLEIAQTFFKIARHEWGHILDYQTRGRGFGTHIRRMSHDLRPAEISAENHAWDADQKDRGERWAQDEILALAVALDD